jgi:hypothetical protein
MWYNWSYFMVYIAIYIRKIHATIILTQVLIVYTQVSELFVFYLNEEKEWCGTQSITLSKMLRVKQGP